MNWDRIEGNWKELKGKIKRPADGISSSGPSSGATGTSGTGRNGDSTTRSRHVGPFGAVTRSAATRSP